MPNFASEVTRIPYAYNFLLSALESINSEYISNKIVILKDSEDEDIVKIIDILQNYNDTNKQSTVYICKHFVCKQPTNDITKMLDLLMDDEG